MRPTRSNRRWLAIGVLVVGAASLMPGAAAAVNVDLERLRTEAERFERDNQWDKAYQKYDEILLYDRSRADIKERRHTCLRLVHQVLRHRDPTYRERILTLSITEAVEIYTDLLGIIQVNYPDRGKVALNRLFQQGVEEFWLALGNQVFRQERLSAVRPEDIDRFRAEMRADYGLRMVRTPRDARLFLRQLAYDAQKSLRLEPTVVVMEFACGACNSLDEYSAYLTPGQLGDEFDSLRGEFGALGVEVYFKDQKLLVLGVVPGSEADKAGIKENDQIVTINGKPVARLTLEGAKELLRAEADPAVELQVAGDGMTAARTVKLRPAQLPSLIDEQILDDVHGIGYVHLIAFQKSTLPELESAVLRLKDSGMRILILDLRGNPGGLFRVAVHVAERFLPEGLITTTQGPIRASHRVFESHSGMSALDVPVIVLIDGATASAAEVLAGALKENNRALLVGQTTFGKASIQRVWQLNAAPAGLRITLARYLSPQGKDYTGVGVAPHIFVERGSMMMDNQKERAREEAKALAPVRP